MYCWSIPIQIARHAHAQFIHTFVPVCGVDGPGYEDRFVKPNLHLDFLTRLHYYKTSKYELIIDVFTIISISTYS